MDRPLPVGQRDETAYLTSAPCSSETPSERVQHLEPGIARDYRKRPCTKCPWATSTDLTEFSDEDMDMLRRANGRPGAEAPMSAPIVSCHRDQPGTAHAWRWCAGFLAVVGEYHLGVRLAVAVEALPPEAVSAPPHWPELYPDLDALLAARAGQLGGQAPPRVDAGGEAYGAN